MSSASLASRYADKEQHLHRLFVAARDGDQAAYAQFLRDISHDLRGFFRKRLQSMPDDVEDLVQDVLLALHQKRHTFDAGLLVTAWVYAIAKYKYVDHLRRTRHRHRHDPLDDAAELFAPDAQSPHDAASDLTQLMAELPDKHRVAILATKIEGLSVQEAAARHAMSESLVKVSVHRGLKKLAQLLQGNPP